MNIFAEKVQWGYSFFIIIFKAFSWLYWIGQYRLDRKASGNRIGKGPRAGN